MGDRDEGFDGRIVGWERGVDETCIMGLWGLSWRFTYAGKRFLICLSK